MLKLNFYTNPNVNFRLDSDVDIRTMTSLRESLEWTGWSDKRHKACVPYEKIANKKSWYEHRTGLMITAAVYRYKSTVSQWHHSGKWMWEQDDGFNWVFSVVCISRCKTRSFVCKFCRSLFVCVWEGFFFFFTTACFLQISLWEEKFEPETTTKPKSFAFAHSGTNSIPGTDVPLRLYTIYKDN